MLTVCVCAEQGGNFEKDTSAAEEDSAPSALLQHAMHMVSSAEEEERRLTADSAAAYTQLAEAQVCPLSSFSGQYM